VQRRQIRLESSGVIEVGVVAKKIEAAGPVGGGWLYDTFGTYQWLYIASAAVGLAAAGMALAFPPAKKADDQQGDLQPA